MKHGTGVTIPMKIYFVRHGVTRSNVERRSMGQRSDESLLPEGIEQAREIAEILPRNFDVLLSSPLRRASETAAIISERHGLPFTTVPELAERDTGSLSGMQWDEIANATGGALTLDLVRAVPEHDFSAYGGETKEAFRERLTKFLRETKERYGGKKVLTVTHAGVLRVLYLLAGGKHPNDSEKMGNTSLHEIEF
ncbi:MAG: putative phosphoglycerate mutase [Parcubacteria group bacterium Gr01-1014_72]|nr:MAG: putative phosphoglycerate mutase [Parcubacteria group bacterium Gr01-1014_72]